MKMKQDVQEIKIKLNSDIQKKFETRDHFIKELKRQLELKYRYEAIFILSFYYY